jgi:hypothetical protein
MNAALAFGSAQDSLITRAGALYQALSGQSRPKMELARRLDPAKLTRIATICHWGRSGSMLLASLLDDHPQVLALPQSLSTALYAFYDAYPQLDLWQKLLVYPLYSASTSGDEGDFFLADSGSGDFAIPAADYLASVAALAQLHAGKSVAWLGSRMRFVQFLHAAYSIARGRVPDASRAIIITAQHYVDAEHAARLASDFPGAKFIHTVRDPISSVDSWLARRIDMAEFAWKRDHEFQLQRFDCAVATLMDLIAWERGHAGHENHTRAVRFEDMHVATECLMQRLARWLDIAYDECLLRSTWNGRPWVVMVRGTPTTGTNPANAGRRQKNLAALDRWLVRALLDENFVAWGYAPRRVRLRPLALALINLALLVSPLKIEFLTLAAIIKKQLLPGIRTKGWTFGLRGVLFLVQRRIRLIVLIARESLQRVLAPRQVMQLLTDE